MDNKQIDLTLEGKKNFELAMQIACNSHPKIVGWSIYETESENKKTKFKHLVLHWVNNDRKDERRVNLFPYEFNTQQAIEFCWGWLEKEPVAYKQPDHDGDNDKGFHLFTESWGQVNSDYTAFIAIKPIWAMYGK